MNQTDPRNSSSRKGLLGRILGLGGTPRAAEPLIVPRAEHEISRKQMAEEVLKVLYRLHNQGHKAYLVGGAVRDLLLGREPKDYDVSTDARPDQMKELFVNSRLIGRRFRLAHIVFKGGRVVEVSTFRRRPDPPDEEADEDGEKDLLIGEDNTWGTPQEDAYRRDFTINALFYNIADFSVIDYVGGLADLKAKVVRTIGAADIRFREDPVRMMRAVEYAARLGFDLHPEVRKAIQKHRKDLRRASVARVADELSNLLKCGSAESAFREMWNLGLLEILYQDLHNALGNGQADRFLSDLAYADRRTGEGRPLRDVPLLAMFFLPALREAVASAEAKKGGRLSKGEFLVNVERILDESQPLFQIPNRRRHQIKQAVLAARKMRRLPSRHRGLASLVERAYFLDSLNLLEVEVETSGEHESVLKEWGDLKAEAQREGRLIDPEERDRRGRRGRGDRGRRRERSGRGRRGEGPDDRKDSREREKDRPSRKDGEEDRGRGQRRDR
ncbi:CCA tRNA nucleotidyltransferase, partial [Gemmatimonadota bacterium]